MSAFSRTDWTLRCDHSGCRASILGENESRASVRREASKRGWVVNVGDGPRSTRRDYCPEHAGRRS